MNGIECPHELESDQDLRALPVVVLTTSGMDKDLLESYNLGIAGYIIMPVEFADFVRIIKNIAGSGNMAILPS